MFGRAGSGRRGPLLAASAMSSLLSLAGSPPGFADGWPQWRGPTLDGRSPDGDVPLRWSPEEGIVWRLTLPARGAATPAIAGDSIYLTVTRDPEVSDEIELWAVDPASGERRWARSLGGGNELRYKQHLASPSPVADEGGVWVLAGTGVLARFDSAGAEIWRRGIEEEVGPLGTKWGFASSPLLLDGDLVVAVLHGADTDRPSWLLRFDGRSGETLWQIERPTEAVGASRDGYATPVLFESAARREVVVSGGEVVTGHDPGTGRELWRLGGLGRDDGRSARIVASPLVVGDLVVAFGKRGPVLALRMPESGPPELVWTRQKGVDVPTPVADHERLYLVDDQGIATALDLRTGAVVWGPERLAVGTYSASPVLAGDRVYAVSEGGTTTVFRAADRFEILARNDLGGYVLASPAISDGRLYLRTSEALWAIGTR